MREGRRGGARGGEERSQGQREEKRGMERGGGKRREERDLRKEGGREGRGGEGREGRMGDSCRDGPTGYLLVFFGDVFCGDVFCGDVFSSFFLMISNSFHMDAIWSCA